MNNTLGRRDYYNDASLLVRNVTRDDVQLLLYKCNVWDTWGDYKQFHSFPAHDVLFSSVNVSIS